MDALGVLLPLLAVPPFQCVGNCTKLNVDFVSRNRAFRCFLVPQAMGNVNGVVAEQLVSRSFAAKQLETKKEWMVLDKSADISFPVLSPTASLVVESLRKPADLSADNVKNAVSHLVSRDDATSVLMYFWHRRNWSIIIQICNCLLKRDSFHSDVTFYNILIDTYARNSQIGEAEKVFQLLDSKEVEPDDETFSLLVNGYRIAGDVKKADALFTRVQAIGYSPGTLTCNIFLGILDDAAYYKRAEEVFEDLSGLGCEPSLDTFNRMISIYSKARAPYKAESLFSSMKRQGCPPDACTFAALISAFARQGLCEEAENYFQEMQDFGYLPDRYAFHALMEAYGQANDPTACEEIFALMKSSGCTPDTVSYNILINAYGRVGLHEDAMGAFEAMISSGVAPNTKSRILLLRSYSNAGRVSELEKLISDMEKDGIKSDDAVVQHELLTAYRVAGRHEEMKSFFKQMKTRDIGTYNTLIQANSEAGELQSAEKLFQSLPKLGLKLNTASWTSLMAGYAKRKLYRKCMSLLKKMVATGCAADATTAKLLLSACRSPEQVEEATETLAALQGRING